MTELTTDLTDALRGVRCRLIGIWAVSPAVSTPRLAERHVERCLACQAQVVRERSIVRALGELRHQLEVAPPDLVPSVRQAIAAEPSDPPPASKPLSWRQRAVALSALSALAVASIAALRRLRTAAA